MSIDTLLDRLKRVKSTGRDTYTACCPAHADKSPSLSIRTKDDGRILIHCFAGCETLSVLDAVGLELNDLIPKQLGEFKSEKKPFHAVQLLQLIAKETTIVALCGSRLTKHPLTDEDYARLNLAVRRINTASDMAGLNHG